jgi:hypothetical protein
MAITCPLVLVDRFKDVGRTERGGADAPRSLDEEPGRSGVGREVLSLPPFLIDAE